MQGSLWESKADGCPKADGLGGRKIKKIWTEDFPPSLGPDAQDGQSMVLGG